MRRSRHSAEPKTHKRKGDRAGIVSRRPVSIRFRRFALALPVRRPCSSRGLGRVPPPGDPRCRDPPLGRTIRWPYACPKSISQSSTGRPNGVGGPVPTSCNRPLAAEHAILDPRFTSRGPVAQRRKADAPKGRKRVDSCPTAGVFQSEVPRFSATSNKDKLLGCGLIVSTMIELCIHGWWGRHPMRAFPRPVPPDDPGFGVALGQERCSHARIRRSAADLCHGDRCGADRAGERTRPWTLVDGIRAPDPMIELVQVHGWAVSSGFDRMGRKSAWRRRARRPIQTARTAFPRSRPRTQRLPPAEPVSQHSTRYCVAPKPVDR